MQTFDYGDGVRATCTFRNLSNVVASPTAVVARVRDPGGTVTTPAATQSATGIYYVDVTLNLEGRWRIRFEGTGAVIAAHEVELKVRDSAFY